MPGARRAQEDPGGHAALPEVCQREDALSGGHPFVVYRKEEGVAVN